MTGHEVVLVLTLDEARLDLLIELDCDSFTVDVYVGNALEEG